MARPELLELRPGWGGGKLNATTILLEPLPRGGLRRSSLDASAAGLDASATHAARILAAADGNPLFLEEMLAMVGEDGAEGEMVVPPTIQAFLHATARPARCRRSVT